MADILLTVPYVSQVNIGGHIGAGLGRTEEMGCWYAAVSMLGYYREAGPRLGVPSQYVKSDGTPHQVDRSGGIQPRGMGANYPELVKNEGLTLIPLPTDKKWTCEKLATLLRDNGPCYMRTKLFTATGTFVGGHILVLIGAKASTNMVVIHDPDAGPNIELSIADLNQKFNWDETPLSKYSMMCKK
jgi:Papain-like cysteine protease AvrRpt2